MLGTSTTSVLGVAFWALAAHAYSPRVVGLNTAAISAVMLVSGVSALGLNQVLIRYLPVAGASTGKLIIWSYTSTAGLSVLVGAGAALTSETWSSTLGFLAHPGWVGGFAAATAATTLFALQDGALVGLRSAQWVPLENTLYALLKLVLLGGLVGLLPHVGPFVAWNAPLPLAIALVSWLIFGRLVPVSDERETFDRRQLVAMAGGNYVGTLFNLAGAFYLPILVTDIASPVDVERMHQLARRTLVHSARLVVPVAVVTTATAPWLLLAFGRQYSDHGATLLRLLSIGLLPNIVVALGVGVARITQRGRTILALAAAHATFVIGLSWALLPDLGITAVGVAWDASQSVLAAALLAGMLRPVLLRRRELVDAAT
jgi:O-antigen/teichoic acid export membrane protein